MLSLVNEFFIVDTSVFYISIYITSSSLSLACFSSRRLAVFLTSFDRFSGDGVTSSLSSDGTSDR